LAALIVDPTSARLVAAVATISGVAITNDIAHLPIIRPSPKQSPRTIKNHRSLYRFRQEEKSA
jgi:hypothetical protein